MSASPPKSPNRTAQYFCCQVQPSFSVSVRREDLPRIRQILHEQAGLKALQNLGISIRRQIVLLPLSFFRRLKEIPYSFTKENKCRY